MPEARLIPLLKNWNRTGTHVHKQSGTLGRTLCGHELRDFTEFDGRESDVTCGLCARSWRYCPNCGHPISAR